ncbi:MAG: response regulator, partial [Xanthomonadales bacterium]|nr:response regulator [Xanthomonadales bacterium]
RFILVADDDHITRLFVQKMLQQAGYESDTAGHGQEAISALESGHYDLVILDCNMPEMDGFAATRFIRSGASRQINPGIPIIALTGLSSETDQHQCLEAGMDAFVSKPVDSQTLIFTVEKCLGNAGVQKPLPNRDELPGGQLNEDGFLDTLITSFVAEVPQLVAALQQAASQEDVTGLENLGHRLRGATGILKISTLSAQSAALENAAKAGDLALASKLASELADELCKLATALEE